MDKRWTRPGTLYLVATPIGNLADMSPRAADVLREVDVLAVEDTRVSLPWLRRIGVTAPALSYHEHSDEERIRTILDRARQGERVGVISDAGLPAVSDPGQHLVEAAWSAGIPVSVIPGPSAGIAAFAGSGFSLPMTVWGFLPPRGRARGEALGRVLANAGAQVVYEAPSRLSRLLEEMAAVDPQRPVLVARELTKLHEEWWRGPVADALRHFGSGAVRGEVSVVLGPKTSQPTEVDWDALLSQVDAGVAQGRSPREAIQDAAEVAGVRRATLYRRWHTRQTT